jgi:peptide/nickel transport system permease protein
LGQGIDKAMLAIVIAWWPWYARLVRAQVISIKERPFIRASQCIGTSQWYIMFRHILPNTIAPVIIQASMDMGAVILTAASLSFIGLGAQAPTPEWGLIISSSRAYILDAWWYSTLPGIVIFVTVLSFNLLGDGLREILDPRTRMR